MNRSSHSILRTIIKEIAEKYALSPQIPDRIVYPHIPADTPLEVSIVGPQKLVEMSNML